jgi:hypothetical protein
MAAEGSGSLPAEGEAAAPATSEAPAQSGFAYDSASGAWAPQACKTLAAGEVVITCLKLRIKQFTELNALNDSFCINLNLYLTNYLNECFK